MYHPDLTVIKESLGFETKSLRVIFPRNFAPGSWDWGSQVYLLGEEQRSTLGTAVA